MSKGNADSPRTIPPSYHFGGSYATQGKVRFFQRGIYTIAHDPTAPMHAGARIHDSLDAGLFAGRLLYDIFLIAPGLLFLHFFCTLWRSLESALNLHLFGLLLTLVGTLASG